MRRLPIASLAIAAVVASGATAAERFTVDELVRGKAVSEAACRAAPDAVLVTVAGRAECIGYTLSNVGGQKAEAVVEFAGDYVVAGPNGRPVARDDYADLDTARLQRAADMLARDALAPAVILARPGTFGSSGSQLTDSKSRREVAVVSAALDAIGRRHGFARYHLIGHGAGGNLAAAMASSRDDVACTVVGSAALAEKMRLGLAGAVFPPSYLKQLYDPLDSVDRVVARPGFRFVVLRDPQSRTTPAEATDAYVDALRARGMPVRVIPATGQGTDRDNLFAATRAVGAGCARGVPDDRLDLLARDRGNEIVASLAVPARAEPTPVKVDEPPPPTAADRMDQPFAVADLISGRQPNEGECNAYSTAVWVAFEGRADCVRYFYADNGLPGSRALLFLNGDYVERGEDGRFRPAETYARQTPQDILDRLQRWARDYRGKVIQIARPGTLGSSGREIDVRHTRREVALVAAAVEEIRRRHNIGVFDVVGQSGGGLVMGGLLAERQDIACAVSASGSLAAKEANRLRFGAPLARAAAERLYDPVDHVGRIQARTELRLFLLTDPLDQKVPAKSTDVFAEALSGRGVPFKRISTTAGDAFHHSLTVHGVRAAIACAQGQPDRVVEAVVARTVVTDRKAPEKSRIGPMPAPVVDANAGRDGDQDTGAVAPPSPSIARVGRPPQQASIQQASVPPGAVQQASLEPPSATTERPFSAIDLIAGRVADRSECNLLRTAVWVEARDGPECIRYYYSEAGGRSSSALVYLPGDMVRGGGSTRPAPRPGYESETPATFQMIAESLSAGYRGPFILLARPGSIGSSGNELRDRRTNREVEVVSLALDQIRKRHGIELFNMVGHSGGGQLVAAMATERSDVGCAVMASPAVAEKVRHRLLGIELAPDLVRRLYDPIDRIADIRPRPDLRMIIVSDDGDRVVPKGSIEAYLGAVRKRNIPIRHILANAADDDRHDAAIHGLRAAVACSLGFTDAAIERVVAATVVSHPTMSEMDAMAPMDMMQGAQLKTGKP